MPLVSASDFLKKKSGSSSTSTGFMSAEEFLNRKNPNYQVPTVVRLPQPTPTLAEAAEREGYSLSPTLGQDILPSQSVVRNLIARADQPLTADQSQQAEKKRRAAQRDAQDPANPVLDFIKDNTIDAAAGAADRFLFDSKPGQFISRFGQSGLKRMGGQPSYEATTGNKTADRIADFTGAIGGAFVNPSNLEQSFVSVGLNNPLTQKAVSYVGSRVGNSLGGRVATEATRGAAAGAFEGGAMSFTRGDSPAQVAQETALGAGLGGAFGAAAPVVGAGLQKLIRTFRPQQAVQGPTLALPEPRTRGKVNTTSTPDIISAPGKVEPIGLPEPRIAPPTAARVARQANPARERLEAFAKSMEGVQLPPGREREVFLEAWGRFAKPNEPDLETMIDLAYSARPNRITPDLAERARETQRMREVAGVGMPVKSFDERYQGGVTGQAAMPDTKVGRIAEPPIRPQRRQRQSIDQPLNEPVRPQPVREPQPQRIADDLDEDDIIEEVTTPRIRDRINTKADELIQSALNDLKSNRLSSNPLDIPTKLAVGYILKGTVKLADFTEQMVKALGEEIRPRARELFQAAKQEAKRLQQQARKEELGMTDVDPKNMKDLSTFTFYSTDLYRNFRNVYGDKFGKVKKAILDPFDEAKKANIDQQESLLNEMKKVVVDGLGIKRGSKLSALVQRYGERQIDLDELKRLAPNDWKKVVKADQWFRQKYNALIDQVNETRKMIYPNNPEKIVPKRNDYYRHFQEMGLFSGIRNLFEQPSAIDPSLVGISEFMLPKSKWASFMQKRGLGPFVNDAVGGFLNYVPSATYAIHIDPHIDVFRSLAKTLADETTESRNLNNFIQFLQRFSQDLAGKTNVLDRPLEVLPGGRKTIAALHMLNNRVKANVILGNLGSAVAQLANIPVGIADVKQFAVPGAKNALSSLINGSQEQAQSQFLKERFAGKLYRQFDQVVGDSFWRGVKSTAAQTKRAAEWMIETTDRIGTTFIWESMLAKGKAKGVRDPIKYADDETRRLVAGRGIGEVPLAQKAKVIQFAAPFTLEVANLWRVMGDFVSKKDFAGLVTLFLGNYLFNRAAEQVRGSGVTFDPIQAIYEAYTAASDRTKSIGERATGSAGRLAGEVLSNVPFGQQLASVYPEYGTDTLPTRKELFGDNDPTRFGEGLLAVKGVQDPLYKLLLPFGGNQLKKTLQGISSTIDGGAFNKTLANDPFGFGKRMEEPELKYLIDQNPANIARQIAFGPNATPEAREFYNNDRRPLGVKDTKKVLSSNNPEGRYDKIMTERSIDKLKRMEDEIRENKEMSKNEKDARISAIRKRIKQLRE